MSEILNRREEIHAANLPPNIPASTDYVKPTDKATKTKLGLVKIGDGIEVSSAGVISVSGGGGGGLAVVMPDFMMWFDETDPNYPPTISAADLTALNAALTAHEPVTLVIPDTDDTYTSYTYISNFVYEVSSEVGEEYQDITFKYDGNVANEPYIIDLDTGVISKVST